MAADVAAANKEIDDGNRELADGAVEMQDVSPGVLCDDVSKRDARLQAVLATLELSGSGSGRPRTARRQGGTYLD